MPQGLKRENNKLLNQDCKKKIKLLKIHCNFRLWFLFSGRETIVDISTLATCTFGFKILMPQGLKKENINLFHLYCKIKKIMLFKIHYNYRQCFLISGTHLVVAPPRKPRDNSGHKLSANLLNLNHECFWVQNPYASGSQKRN